MVSKTILLETLQSGLQELKIDLAMNIQEKLIAYIELLAKWNGVHNLTAIRDPVKMVQWHLVDSLALLPHLPSGRIIDVGTGAGLPGIPLALCRGEEVVLLDSLQKKMTFVEHVILSLKVTNAAAVCSRVEKYQPKALFELVISRAFASLADFIHSAQHLCKPSGRLVAMKGTLESEELAAVPEGFSIEKMISVSVPGIDRSRHLVFIKRGA